MPLAVFAEPLIACAVDGEIVITGPGRFHGSFEPEAMRLSLQALHLAYAEALEQGQRALI